MTVIQRMAGRHSAERIISYLRRITDDGNLNDIASVLDYLLERLDESEKRIQSLEDEKVVIRR